MTTPPRHHPALLLWLLLVCFHISTVASFVATPTTSTAVQVLPAPGRVVVSPSATVVSSTTRLFLSKQPSQTTDYNDDAFGLVFLCGATVAQDAVFSSLFLVLSGVAAIATKQGKLPSNNQVPAAVAGVTLLLTIGILLLAEQGLLAPPLDAIMGDWSNSSKSPSATWIEVALCMASMVYGFVLAPPPADQET